MYWLNKHTRLRNQLSPYLDGALSSTETSTLEAHLATCEACRAELDELRATVAATRQLPRVDAPRSFALSPQLLEGRAVAPAPSAPPLALGMRLASAGLAVFLAVVVIGDLSGVGGGSDGTREAIDESGSAFRSMAEADVAQEEAGAAVPAPDVTGAAEGYDATPPADDATSAAESDTACPAGAGAAGGGAGTGAIAETPAATPIPQPPATPTAELRGQAASGCEEQPIAGAVAPTTSVAEPEPARDAAEERLSAEGAVEAEDNGGISTLRIVETILGGALIVLLAGIALELAFRRRRTV
jgi:hypothetical protein